MTFFQRALVIPTLLLSLASLSSLSQADDAAKATKSDKTKIVEMVTSKGTIEIELNAEKAPISVKNFLNYANKGFYDNTIFHRVIPGFMIQGGGFTNGMVQKATDKPIRNEANNGLHNNRGTIAMARTNKVHSATSQFFINVNTNTSLNHSTMNFGYAVFGKVTKGMDIVDSIVSVPTGNVGHYQNVPKNDVIIKSVKLKK